MSIPLDENERRAQAQRFLDALDPDDPVHLFQAVGPKGHPELTRVLQGTLEALWPELCWLSGSGADIYVTVNHCAGGQRKRSAVDRVRAVWRENDGGAPERAFPLEPGIVVATSEGHDHSYWPTSGPPERFEAVQRRLVQDWGSDPNAADLARVLRLPGFPNRKPGRGGFVARLIQCNGTRYTWTELEHAFPPVDRTVTGPSDAVTVLPPSEGQLEELERALVAIPADDRETWIAVAHALKTGGEACRALWEAWSATSPKWDPGDADYRWDTMRPERTHWEAVYTIAAEHGWQRARPEDFEPHGGPETAEGAEAAPGGVVARGPDGTFRYALRARDAVDVAAVLEPGGWEPEWLVDGLLPRELCALIGAGGVGKTTVLLWQIVLLALGRPLYGCEVVRALQQVYITHEDPRRLLEYRLQRIMAALDLTWAERRSVLRRLCILDASEVYAPWVARDPQSGAYGSTQHAREVVEEYRAWADVAYVDPFVQVGVGDENDNRAMNGAVIACRQVRAGLGGAVRVAHHTGKEASRQQVIDLYSGRGGSALGDGARQVSVLVPHRADKEDLWVPPGAVTPQAVEAGAVLREHVVKQSWGVTWREPVWLVRDGYAWRWERGLALEAVQEAKLERASARQRERLDALVDCIAQAAREGRRGSARDWRESARLRLATGLGERDLRALLKLAVEQGRLEEVRKPLEKGELGRPQTVLVPVEK